MIIGVDILQRLLVNTFCKSTFPYWSCLTNAPIPPPLGVFGCVAKVKYSFTLKPVLLIQLSTHQSDFFISSVNSFRSNRAKAMDD